MAVAPVEPALVDHVLAAEDTEERSGGEADLVVEQRGGGDIPSETDACGPVVVLDAGDDGAEEGGLPLDRISTLGGVPLLYGRGAGGPMERTFSVEHDFSAQLERTVAVVVKRAPVEFGALRSITSAGMFVDKPNSLHAVGRACDWDVMTFAHVTISPFRKDHASPRLAARQRYWSLAALLRSSSAYVLHAESNADHQDHLHQDNGAMTAFDASSPTTVKLVQALCNEVFQAEPRLGVDGRFGHDTRAAVAEALGTVGLNGDLTSLTTWRRFLRRSARLGFRLSV